MAAMPDGQWPHTNLADFLYIAAQKVPDKVAIETDSGCYTYGQMVRMVESIRLVLRRALSRCPECQMPPVTEKPAQHRRRADEHTICIVLDRGPECVAAVHATMLERCVYNTFDAAEPREKLKCWIEIAQHPVMITSRPVMDRLGLTEKGWSFGGDFPRFVVDIQEVISSGEDRVEDTPPPEHRAADLDRLCYVIFTSGSTGKPKAVMIEHRSACNLVRVWSNFVGLGENDRCGQMASMAFDNHVPEVYGAMFKCCTSVVVPDIMKRSGPDMLGWLADKQVNLMVTVPSHLRSMSGPGVDVSTVALPHLRVLDIGGEALGRDVLDAWAPGRSFFNIYGPTEITVVCCGIPTQPGDEITIGYDLPTYTNKVLNQETLEECAVRERGVLYTGGIGTARGYLDDEAKTNSKFVNVPKFGRMYISGDVVSKDTLGRFHYHGRADWQVKVRGIRIELEALEEAVGNVPGVKHCESRVIDEGRKLVMIASGPNPDEGAIKEAAAKLGKGYVLNMVKIVDQSAWKFNTSGKLVRNVVRLDDAEEDEEGGAAPKDSFQAFKQEDASETELEIAACVAQLITSDAWDRDSHFIEDLGLDSAGFGKLITLLRRKPALAAIDLPTLFENPTVALLAGVVEGQKDESSDESAGEEDARPERAPAREDLLHTFAARCVGHPLRSAASSNATKLLSRIPIPPRQMPAVQDRRCHALCVEGQGAAKTYVQVYHMALAIQTLLRRAERAAGARQEDGQGGAVFVALEAQAEYVAGMVAALLERRAFCVVSPAMTGDRFAACLETCRPSAVIADPRSAAEGRLQALVEAAPQSCGIVDVGKVADVLGKPLRARRPRTGAGICYIALSAGSSGRAKACTFEHSALAWAARAWHKDLDLNREDRVAQMRPHTEMEHTTATWAALDAGAALMLPPGDKAPGAGLRAWLAKHRVTALGATPQGLRSLGSEGALSLTSLRLLFTSGAQCPPGVAQLWAEAGRTFVNGYSSFGLLGACSLRVEAGSHLDAAQTSLPYGQPMPGMQLHLLGEHGEMVPRGHEGGLYIGGPGLAHSFLGDIERDPLVVLEGLGPLFATGESARQGMNGLELFGRQHPLVGRSMGTTPGGRTSRSGAAGLAGPSYRSERGAGGLMGPSFGRMGSFRTTAPTPKVPREVTAGTFANYLIQRRDSDEGVGEPFGEGAYLILNLVVQSLYIFVGLLGAVLSEVLVERFLFPWSLRWNNLLVVFIVMTALPIVQKYLMTLLAIILKWTLIGRYKVGSHSVYSTFYLRHWIVEQVAGKSILGGGDTQGGWAFSVGANFSKVLALRILGAKVALSATITTKVAGYDLVTVGPLASVHGPYHLTAINYVGKRMVLNKQRIGSGATICHQSCVAAGAVVRPGAFVEPCSSVPPDAVVEGRWSGVPGRRVGSMPLDRSVPRRKGSSQDDVDGYAGMSETTSGSENESSEDGEFKEGGCCGNASKRLAGAGFLFAFGPVLFAPFGLAMGYASILVFRKIIQMYEGEDWANKVEQQEELPDGLPPVLDEHLWLFMALYPVYSVINEVWSLIFPILVCRILPRAKAGMDVPLFHPRAIVAAAKLSMVAKASQDLGDASMQAWYLRMCGAKIGKGSSMSEQTMLPETVEIGENCFMASGNTFTSVEVDQGRMRVPCRTVVGADCFFGNENHVAEGILPGTFVGLRTWVRHMPTSAGSLFGNPPMKFGRPSLADKEMQGTCFQKFWYHFSTSVIDVFFWKALHGLEKGVSFFIGRTLFPEYTWEHWPWQFLAEVAIFAVINLVGWWLVSVRFAWCIYHDKVPLENDFYSCVVMRWFNVNKIRRVFKPPFAVQGTMWHSFFLRALGTQVGKRFFSPNEDVMIDPIFGRLGDDVTIDYDGQVRQHSFEDNVLKWGPNYIGAGTNVLQGGMVAMSDCGQGVALLRGAVTWKGQALEPGWAHDGAPCAAVMPTEEALANM